jgi:diguanylate cyclase (GGDEF)-like protein
MFYAVGHDVTDQKHFEERLRFEATHDRLTGLPNRGYFLETLENQITFNHRRHNDLFAVFFIDLDRFKLINDTLGHQAGDHLLIAIAQRLQACMREGDMVARLGGDEFAVLLNSVSSLKDVTSVAQRMLDTIAEPITLKTESTYTTASIGIVLSASHYNDSDLMLRDADAAMYQAKEAGKARYVIF